MRIITLTLNPAYDIHCEIPDFTLEKENKVEAFTRSLGGKGINITRALLKWGINTEPFLILGDENPEDFVSGMASEGISSPIIMYVHGRNRENITIHPNSGKETRICYKGFKVESGTLEKVYELISPTIGDIVTFSGSLPVGISISEMEQFLFRLKEVGVKLVIDSKSVSLEMLGRLKPWLIKPNDEEIAAYFGELSDEGIVNAAKTLYSYGIENAIVSLGEKGAVLASCEGVFRGIPPKIEVLSTIGAGDSLVSGFIATEGDSAERLRMGIAYGTAACLREGTNPPLPEDINRLSREVVIEKIM